MSTQLRAPYRDLQQTMRFYERLGFSSRAEERGPEMVLIVECQDIALEFQPDFGLNPFKNGHVFLFQTAHGELSGQFAGQYVPEDSECQGWVQTLKNGGVHIVDPNGNLLMISKKG